MGFISSSFFRICVQDWTTKYKLILIFIFTLYILRVALYAPYLHPQYRIIKNCRYTTNDINHLKRIQRWTARFIPGNYKSKEEGSITNMLADLELENLQSRTSKWLVLLYWMVEGLVLVINPEEFSVNSKPKMIIKPRRFEDFESATKVINSVKNNSKALETTPRETEQYKNSFFIKNQWYHLDGNIVCTRSGWELQLRFSTASIGALSLSLRIKARFGIDTDTECLTTF